MNNNLLSCTLVGIDSWYSQKRKIDRMSGPMFLGLIFGIYDCLDFVEKTFRYINPILYHYDRWSKGILVILSVFPSRKRLERPVIYPPIRFHWSAKKRHLPVMTCISCTLPDNVPNHRDSSFPNHK